MRTKSTGKSLHSSKGPKREVIIKPWFYKDLLQSLGRIKRFKLKAKATPHSK